MCEGIGANESGARKALESRDFTVGEQMVEDHSLKKHHPVILIPGIVSTGLESWGTESVARPFFRKRLWVRRVYHFLLAADDQGTSTMIRVRASVPASVWATF